MVMTQTGVSIKKFSKLIGNDPEALVRDWSLGKLAPSSEHKTDIGYGWRPQSGIAVGRVAFAHDKAVTFEVDETAYRTAPDNKIHLVFDDPKLSEPWRHIVGTTLAAEVSVIPSDNGFSTHFRPERILAVQPPVNDPRSKDAVRLTHKSGYVQGIVKDITVSYDELTPAVLQLQTPHSDEPVTLNYLTLPRISMPDGLTRDALEPNDIVRAGVTRGEGPLYVANGLVHHLGSVTVANRA